ALLGDGTLRDLPGGVDEYLRRRRQAGPGAGATLDTGGASAAPARGGAAEARAAAKEQSRIERAMEKLDARAQKLHAQLAEHSTDYAKVAELDTQLRAVTAEKTELEDRWLELADLG
ncbi:MAG: transporter with duplicated ATPase domain, partial [Mycobacterium sp.]|nr:transporter with duplicated ATPase domain [Mycobacterium sp.]